MNNDNRYSSHNHHDYDDMDKLKHEHGITDEHGTIRINIKNIMLGMITAGTVGMITADTVGIIIAVTVDMTTIMETLRNFS